MCNFVRYNHQETKYYKLTLSCVRNERSKNVPTKEKENVCIAKCVSFIYKVKSTGISIIG